ncbi:tissue factor pathway inhibitor 2 precursor [Silurus asotus]|uniref:Tissue factor pathway inhibitor 2 n=1 Tax=Silurus asotus TaxID=30991 RepID=A0AAD5AT01_SILAS|nr:tissue factor pathway inhibitor 2 precursor [Silurus asotus]
MEGRFLACILLLSFINGAFFYKPSPMDICLLQVEEGPCLEDVPRFYYNTLTQACEPFSYGGCDGNANNFKSNVACHKTCYRIPTMPVICQGGSDKGTGSASIPRFYYDSNKKTCKQFEYTGSGGNNNNFVSMESCMSVCTKTEQPISCYCAFNPLVYNVLTLTHHRCGLVYKAKNQQAEGSKKFEVNVDETEGVSDENRTENRHIPDHHHLFCACVLYVDLQTGSIH